MTKPVRLWSRRKAVLVLACLAAAGCSQDASFGSNPAVHASPAERAAAPPPAAPAPIKASTAFELKGTLALDRQLQAGEFAWEHGGAPDGPLFIAVDLGAQRIYVYRGGVEIGRSSIIYGADNKPTPTGTFPILEKDADHVSNLYHVPMPYMLRLTMDGVAIHASQVEDGTATNGCVGVPDEFAALLFAEAKLGDQVLVTDAWMRTVYYGAKPKPVAA